MKKKIAALAIILFLACSSISFARGHRGGQNHGYHDGGHPGYRRHNSPKPYGNRGGGHHNNGLEVALGVVGNLLLGSALMYSVPPPLAVVRQPRICVADQTVTGEWQINKYDGRKIWLSFPYPVTQRVKVPCF